MAIDFTPTFGTKAQAGATSTTKTDKPKAEFWLNVGYPVEYKTQTPEGVVTEIRFVSLPVGIPLDTQEDLPTTSRNEQYAQFQAARNDLLAQLKEAARSLAPGEEQTINLSLQLRRVNGEQPAATTVSNPFVRPLKLVA